MNETTITRLEIDKFWVKYSFIILSWFLLSFFTVITVLSPIIAAIASVWLDNVWWIAYFFPFVPAALILKYGLGVKNIWILNDTKDGDFGDPRLLKKYNLQDANIVVKFIWWWLRNICWNYISKFKPDWKGGSVDINKSGIEEFLTIKNTLTKELPDYGRWTRADRDNGIFGIKYIAYRINGKVYCQYSKAGKKQLIFGAGGDRYKCHIRL